MTHIMVMARMPTFNRVTQLTAIASASAANERLQRSRLRHQERAQQFRGVQRADSGEIPNLVPT